MLRALLACLLSLALTPAIASAQGLTSGGIVGDYFHNGTLTGTPSFERTDVRLDFAWNGASPGGSTAAGYVGMPATGFSARWTGTLIAPSTGTFTFLATTSGPARVYLTPPGSTTATEIIAYAGAGLATNTGTFAMKAGQSYGLVMEFQDQSSPAVATLQWQGYGFPRRAVEAGVGLGVNITSLADWDGSRMFADAMRQSRGWFNANNYSQTVPSDANGWPIEDFLTIPIAGPVLQNGTYQLTFNGEAQVELMFGYGGFVVGGTTYDGVLPSGVGYNAQTNTTTAQMVVTPSTNINMFLNFTNTQRSAGSATNTGVTNIHLLRPAAPGSTVTLPATTLFNTALKQRVKTFTTLRFMDYFQTNGSAIEQWSDRTLPGTNLQALAPGGALEYAIMFANETGKDMWINIPVSAGDDYATKIAQMLLYGSDGVNPYTSRQAHPVYPALQPNLAAYIEYSNEVWNFAFPQASTNYNAAVAEVNAGGSPLNYDGSTNSYYWGWRRVGLRIKQISDDFRAVWGSAAIGTRIRPVLEWQADGGQDTADQQLSFLSDYYDNTDGIAHSAVPHPVSYFLYGGGGGWYHSVNDASGKTVASMYASGLVEPTSVPTDAAWAHTFGLKATGYEGGFEIGGDTPNQLQLNANVAPQAQAMTLSGEQYFFGQGGDLALIYTIAGESAYGLADPTVYQGASPKEQAVAMLTSAPKPAAIAGTAIGNGTTTVPTTAADVAHNMWGSWGSTVYVCPGCWLDWTVNSTVPSFYLVGTNLGSVPGQDLMVDGTDVGNSGATVALVVGLHTVRVRNTGTDSLPLTGLVVTRN